VCVCVRVCVCPCVCGCGWAGEGDAERAQREGEKRGRERVGGFLNSLTTFHYISHTFTLSTSHAADATNQAVTRIAHRAVPLF
jgi:hypothetical protein